MQRHAVAFAIENDRPKAVRPYRVNRLDHRSAVRHDLLDSVPNPPVHVQVKHYAPGRDLRFVKYQAAAVSLLVLNDAKREVAECFPSNPDAQNCAIERRRSVEISDRDIEP